MLSYPGGYPIPSQGVPVLGYPPSWSGQGLPRCTPQKGHGTSGSIMGWRWVCLLHSRGRTSLFQIQLDSWNHHCPVISLSYLSLGKTLLTVLKWLCVCVCVTMCVCSACVLYLDSLPGWAPPGTCCSSLPWCSARTSRRRRLPWLSDESPTLRPDSSAERSAA